MRMALGLDKVPRGVSPDKKDQIIYDVGPDGKSASGWGHPTCGKQGGRCRPSRSALRRQANNADVLEHHT